MSAAAITLVVLAAAALPPLVEEAQIGKGWRVTTLPRQTKPVTRFTPETVDGRPALRVEADRSYGNLVFDLAPEGAAASAPASGPAPRTLSWSWRMQQPLKGTDLHQRSGDDTALKVCLAFDLPAEKLGFGERQLLRMMRASASPEPLPAQTLCWVWGAGEARNELLDNAFTRRVRYIVLRNASDPSATWFDETRDIAVDYRRAFGDESATLPPLVSVLVSGDADNTAGHSIAQLAGLRLEP